VRSRSKSGFTMLEAMFTMAIFSLVLSALAYSLGQLSRVSLARKDFGFELEALHVTKLIRDDARNAQQVSVTGTGLVFVGQNTEMSLNQRLGYGLNSIRSKATVAYQYTDGWLYRTKSTDLTDAQRAPVNQLTSFSVERDGNVARVRFTSEKINAVQSFETVVRLP
jgi:prepilin-type N-terminal cleavage/methylation domain-containing protein